MVRCISCGDFLNICTYIHAYIYNNTTYCTQMHQSNNTCTSLNETHEITNRTFKRNAIKKKKTLNKFLLYILFLSFFSQYLVFYNDKHQFLFGFSCFFFLLSLNRFIFMHWGINTLILLIYYYVCTHTYMLVGDWGVEFSLSTSSLSFYLDNNVYAYLYIQYSPIILYIYLGISNGELKARRNETWV